MKIGLSVIMPSFLGEYDGCATDREKKFVRAVQSFLDNTLIEKELIIIGDNCILTKKILYDIYEKEINFGNIKFYQFNKKQKVFSGSLRSKGIDLASYDYISYLDTDDMIGNNHLSSILNQIKTQDDCEIALDRVYKLMQENIAPNSKESEELENLSILIKEFESKVYKLPKD